MKWNIKLVYTDKTIPTKVFEGSFEEAIEFVLKVEKEDKSICGFYISKFED